MSERDYLPDFILLGAAKAGTTALYHYLDQHPQIYMTPLKETNYFALSGQNLDFRGPGDGEFVNRLSITDEAAYHAQFHGRGEQLIAGEASPLYLYHAAAPERIQAAVPNARFIIILRNPIDRAYSAFLHLVRDDRETTRDFEEALALEHQRIDDNYEHIWHYLSMGRYYEQVKRYYDRFSHEQIKVFLYRDLRESPHDLMRDTFNFLGVDKEFQPDTATRYNEATLPAAARPPLLPSVRARLQEELRPQILQLQDLIGRDLSHWLTRTLLELEAETSDST